jgi:hypothetical protein
LLKDKDVREFLALLAKAAEPRNASTYINTYGNEFSRRYRVYTLRSLTNSNHRKNKKSIMGLSLCLSDKHNKYPATSRRALVRVY